MERLALAMRSEGVERATAAVFVNGTRTGSAVLVDRHHALTAGHVIGNGDLPGPEVCFTSLRSGRASGR
jgi:V8-like Glu-specific endopeptidase